METINLQTTIGADGHIRLDVPSALPPGPADVVVVIRSAEPAVQPLRWADYYGRGKEIWGAEDAQEYVNRLRDE
jgi:hypothetical protein